MTLRVIKLVISIFYYFFYKVYSLLYRLINGKYPKNVVVLTYHSIKKKDTKEFEKQMSEIIKSGQAISVDLLDEIVDGGKYFLVTFDDGYQCLLKYAIPVLQKKNIPAIIFITTGYLGKCPGWITNENNKNKYEILLTEDQIKDKSLSSIQFGSHTVYHPHLNLLDNDRLCFEIFESKKVLENIIRKEIKYISLPFGSYNSEVMNRIVEAGYSKIFLNVPVIRKSSHDRYVLLGRVDVSVDDWWIEFKIKTLGGYDWLPAGIFVKKLFKNALSSINSACFQNT
jgi:peptidoglycan/xylan/chitin deacetylase (PgdA/CDA1 family)